MNTHQQQPTAAVASQNTKSRFSRTGWVLAVALGFFLLARGSEFVVLGLVGVPDHALIVDSIKKNQPRGGPVYTAYYEFSTEQGGRFHGSERGFPREPARYSHIPILFLKKFPSINRAQTTPIATAITCLLYLLPAIVAISLGTLNTIRNEPRHQRGSVPVSITLLLAALAGFTAYAVDRPELFKKQPHPADAPALSPEALGNSPGNLRNRGLAASNGSTIFFCKNGFQPIHRTGPDNMPPTLFHPGFADYLNLSGDDLYFRQFDSGEGTRIYRIQTSGGRAKRIRNESVSGLWVAGDYLFFTPEHGDSKLHRAHLDGSHVEKLHDDVARCVNLTQEWVFYCNDAKDGHVFRMRHNGAERTEIGNSRTESLLAAGTWLFYCKTSEGNVLRRMRQDGTDDAPFLHTETRMLNSDGTWLYYTDAADSRFYRVPLEGGTPQPLADEQVWWPQIVGDWILAGVGPTFSDLLLHRLPLNTADGTPGPLEAWPEPLNPKAQSTP